MGTRGPIATKNYRARVLVEVNLPWKFHHCPYLRQLSFGIALGTDRPPRHTDTLFFFRFEGRRIRIWPYLKFHFSQQDNNTSIEHGSNYLPFDGCLDRHLLTHYWKIHQNFDSHSTDWMAHHGSHSNSIVDVSANEIVLQINSLFKFTHSKFHYCWWIRHEICLFYHKIKSQNGSRVTYPLVFKSRISWFFRRGRWTSIRDRTSIPPLKKNKKEFNTWKKF